MKKKNEIVAKNCLFRYVLKQCYCLFFNELLQIARICHNLIYKISQLVIGNDMRIKCIRDRWEHILINKLS